MSGPAGALIVAADDAPENLALVRAVLQAKGHQVLSCRDGEACLTLLLRVVPRLVLLDIEMPGMGGIETCRRIRSWVHFGRVPIAFLTARNTAEDVVAGLKAGGNDFIRKPVDPATLLARVQHWLKTPVVMGQALQA